jgi:pimeloyl-ACP methyl ester carboxylesterase
VVTPRLEVRRLDGAPAKPPILFLHGAWLGAWCWQDWMQIFNARGHTVIAPSYRGHGNSGGRERLRSTRLSEYLEDVVAVAATLEQPPVIVAHSMGGAVAQRFLELHPGRAAVLVSSAPPSGCVPSVLRLALHHPLEFALINLTLSLGHAVRTPALVRELFHSPSTPEGIVLETWARSQDESFLAFLDLLTFRSGLVAGKLPMLVLGGVDDGIFTPREVRDTARVYGAKLKLFEGAGHNLMLEANRAQIANDILEWLGSLS